MSFFLLYSYSPLLFGAWSIKIQIKNTRIVIYDAFKEKKNSTCSLPPHAHKANKCRSQRTRTEVPKLVPSIASSDWNGWGGDVLIPPSIQSCELL